MSDSNKAIFLSYARDDASAARRIAEALRSSGLEVWFDENELRGGEAWDAKIRKQIDACTLFLAVISQHTQARAKGYFRLEWKLAVEQTHLLLEGVPFVVPVVIDDTPESTAAVPAEFMRVQWTRLPGALPTPQFVEQVKRLLDAPSKPQKSEVRSQPPSPSLRRPGRSEVGDMTASPRRRAIKWLPVACAILVIGIGGYFTLRPRPDAAVQASNPKPNTQNSAPMDFASAKSKSIAVLPFANLSTEKENEFFADGLHDDVITNLAKIRDLTVISRTSVLAYRDAASRNLKQIAAELGVATILEGSVRRVGSKVHMNAQLIDARTDAHLWADTFDGDASDVFALQASLARQIAVALKATLTPGERALIEHRPTENQAAYDFYLRARAQESGMSPRSGLGKYKEVEALYEQSVARDPGFALAYARLTWVHGVMYLMANLDPVPERKSRAQATLQRCEQLAPDAPETHLARGAFAYYCDNDWAKALAEFQAAEAGLPNEILVLGTLAFTLRRVGRWPEALTMFARVMVVSPNDLYFGGQSVSTSYYRGHFSEARGLAERLVELFPNDVYVQDFFVRAQYQLDGDRAAYLRSRVALPLWEADPHGLMAAYYNAILLPDLGAADRALADPRMGGVQSSTLSLIEPAVLHRAFVAFLRGDRTAAVRFADEAIALFRAGQWTPRQEPFVTLAMARAETYAGRSAEAGRHAQATLVRMGRDGLDGMFARSEVGRIYAALGRQDEALALLRELLQTASDRSPREIRADPLWSRLKDDPRFEKILQSAKPL